MRKTLTAVLLAMTLPTLAMAMPDGGPRHGGGQHGEHGSRLFKELDTVRILRGPAREDRMVEAHASCSRLAC